MNYYRRAGGAAEAEARQVALIMGLFSRPRTSRFLVRLFGPRISLTITPDEFVFGSSDRVLALRPILFVHDGIIVGVGSPPAEAAEELPVLVSDPQERAQRLERLVRFGIESLLVKRLSVKPMVFVSLQTNTVSYEEIKTVLASAGVGIVRYAAA